MQKNRKKEHKKVVKFIRQLNKKISNDLYLGINRFRIDMVTENWRKFEDGSGGTLIIVLKISDKLTNNKACFIVDNYDYWREIYNYANDFLIRCSSGHAGHYPPLHYVAYDIHSIVPYNGSKNREIKETEDGVIDYYDWIEIFKLKEVINSDRD